MNFRITEITIAHEKTPLGMDIREPSIAWKFTADGKNMKQCSARILVGTTDGGRDMWDSGIMMTDRSIGIKYGGKPLCPCTRYFVRVEVTAEDGSAANSDTFFETGFLDGSMRAWDGAEWIGAPEYYVRSDALGIFSIESDITVSENGAAGIIFGANDARLGDPNLNEKQICGENYICYEISLKSKALNIYRVGYDKNDSADKPFAEIPANVPQANEKFSLKIEVTGNCSAAYINGAMTIWKYLTNTTMKSAALGIITE